MTLVVDVGNTQLMGGLFLQGELVFRFRKHSSPGTSSDELGLFFRSVIRENGYDPEDVDHIGVCSVVPGMNHSLASACMKYFSMEPFMLRHGVETGLINRYNKPGDVGADRLANGVAGTQLFPRRNLVIFDLGTATTVDVITENGEYLGGAIHPGLKISMGALEQRTARLPSVEILKPQLPWGQSTRESIQAGLYYGHVGFIREIIKELTEKLFEGEKPLVIGTGGFSSLFKESELFDEIIGDLVLWGIKMAMDLNKKEIKK